MKAFFASLVLLVAFSSSAFGQDLFGGKHISKVTTVQSSAGTTPGAAISPPAIAPNVLSFKVCNNAVNTSTYLFVGFATDPATDGVQLGLGQCLDFPNTAKSVLGQLKVKAQAASNGYSVIQYSGG